MAIDKRRVKIRNMIVPRGIGFRFRQREFFDKYPDFKPDEFCRKAIDEQIKLIDPKFLEVEEDE